MDKYSDIEVTYGEVTTLMNALTEYAARHARSAKIAEAVKPLLERLSATRYDMREGTPSHRMNVAFPINDRQYERLCVLRDVLAANGYERAYPGPGAVLETVMEIGSENLINRRLDTWEASVGINNAAAHPDGGE